MQADPPRARTQVPAGPSCEANTQCSCTEDELSRQEAARARATQLPETLSVASPVLDETSENRSTRALNKASGGGRSGLQKVSL